MRKYSHNGIFFKKYKSFGENLGHQSFIFSTITGSLEYVYSMVLNFDENVSAFFEQLVHVA